MREVAGTWMHITVRTVHPHAPLCEPEHAPWLWERLRGCFPRALSAVLMPNQPHLLVDVDDPERERTKLARILGHFARRVGVPRGLFESIPPFEVVHGREKLWRTCRYLALNACRAGLCDDPLRWHFSTARDIVGAIADPWVSAADLGRELQLRAADVGASFHRYSSGDPSVSVAGTPHPMASRPQSFASVGLRRIALAAAAATRSAPCAITRPSSTRRLFVLLARHQGWRDSSALAALCQVDRRTIARLAARPEPGLLGAGALCLGDARLHHPIPRWPRADGVSIGDETWR